MEEDGTLVFTAILRVSLDEDPPPHVADGWLAGVVTDPRTEVQSVVVLKAP